MMFFNKNGEWVLVWSGISLFFVAAIVGIIGAVPVSAEVNSIHTVVATAIRDHIAQGAHSGALTRNEALLTFAAVQGIILALVGAVYHSVVHRMESQATDIHQIRNDLTALQGDQREFSGEMKATLKGLDGRIEGFSQAQAIQMQNMIDIMAKINASLKD